MLQRLVKSAGSMALVLALCVAIPNAVQAGWNYEYTPAWSAGHGGPSGGYWTGVDSNTGGYYGGGYYGGGYGYSGYAGYPVYPGAAATPGYTYTAPYYGAPAYASIPAVNSTMVGAQPANKNDQAVRLDVRVPGNAKIWVEGKEMQGNGQQRRFVSPPLERGANYTYDIRATWQEGGRTVERKRHLTVHAGDRLNVDLTSPSQSTPVTTGNARQ